NVGYCTSRNSNRDGSDGTRPSLSCNEHGASGLAKCNGKGLGGRMRDCPSTGSCGGRSQGNGLDKGKTRLCDAGSFLGRWRAGNGRLWCACRQVLVGVWRNRRG